MMYVGDRRKSLHKVRDVLSLSMKERRRRRRRRGEEKS
jgi:hypothetical protein